MKLFERQHECALLTRLLPVVALFSLTPADAANWEITPRVEAGQGYTSNVELTPEDNHDWITEVTPGVTITRQASQFEASADYQLQNLWYRENGDFDDHYHDFSGSALARSANNAFTVNATANYDQQNIDPEGAIGYSNLLQTGNRTDVARAQISPAYKTTLARNLDTELLYSYSIVDYRNTDDSSTTTNVDDSRRHFVRTVVGDLESPGLWDWQANYQFSRTEFDNSDDGAFEYQRAGGQIGYAINPRTRLLFSAGLESDIEDDTRAGDLDAHFWDAGFSWQPTSRQFMELRAGERYYGSSYFFQWNRRARKTQLNVDYTEEAVTANDSLFELGNTGVPDAGNRSRLDADVYIRRRGGAGFRLDLARSAFDFNVYYEDRDYQLSERSENVAGIRTQWSLDLGRRTRLSTLVDVERQNLTGDEDLYRFRIRLERELSRILSARLAVGRLVRNANTGTGDYRSNGASLYFSASF